MRIFRVFGVLVVSLCFFVSTQVIHAAAAPVNFIAHKSVTVDKMGKSKLKKIFKGKILEWGDGNKTKVILYMETSTHKAFCKSYLKNSPVQLKNNWKNLLFTGQILGNQLKRFDNVDQLIQFINQNEYSIGFLPSDYKGTLPENVKTITIEEVN